MGQDHFTTVFDVTRYGFRNWEFPAFGLIFVALGLIFFFFPRVITALRIPARFLDSGWSKTFRYFYLGFALIWTLVAFSATFSQYESEVSLVRNGQCRTVEGAVEDFVPMPYTGHADETFTVGGVRFAYSDYNNTGGFNNSASHGGPISKSSYVRICYDPSSNAILTLAIKNYRGPLKDYGAVDIFDEAPSTKADQPAIRQPDVPWWTGAFVYVFLLNYIGIFFLYRPYLRLFPVLSRKVIADGALPRALDDGQSLKLNDVLARWDAATTSLWLRPRGLNSFSVSQVVARLETDPAGRQLLSQEVRFAIGFPVTILLFFAGAIGMFVHVMPRGTFQYAFLGIFFVIATITYVRAGRRSQKRMEVFVAEAIEELKAPAAQISTAQ